MTPILLTLPVPPSINKAYKTFRGRRSKTQATKDWEAYAGRELRAQGSPRVRCADGVIAIVNIDRGLQDGHTIREDADNRVKLLFDLLVREDVIEDDSAIASFAVAWAPPHSRVCRIAILPSQPLEIRFHPAKSVAAAGGWIIPAAIHEEEAA